MGSHMLAEDLGYDIMHEIMNGFQEVTKSYNIICKCNAKFITRQKYPATMMKNILFVDWMQQNELLGKDPYDLFPCSGVFRVGGA